MLASKAADRGNLFTGSLVGRGKPKVEEDYGGVQTWENEATED